MRSLWILQQCLSAVCNQDMLGGKVRPGRQKYEASAYSLRLMHEGYGFRAYPEKARILRESAPMA